MRTCHRSRSSLLTRRQSRDRNLRIESLESRLLLAAEFRNPVDHLDVNNSGTITALDALVVINDIVRNGAGQLPVVRDPRRAFIDTSGDNRNSGLDALRVINFLSRNRAPVRTLTDRDFFDTQQNIDIRLGATAGARIYRLQVDANFGTPSNSSLIPDLFSVYLVDPSNSSQTLLDRGSNGTSLFSLSPRGSELATGIARWDGSVLELDLSSIADIDTGRLRLQLLNGDSTSNSTVLVRPLTNTIDNERVPGQRFLIQSAPLNPSAALDVTALTDSQTVQATVENVRFDASSGQLIAEVGLTNVGAAIGRDVALVLPGLPTGVTLQNASGVDSTGTPYLNLRDAIRAGGLGQNQLSNRVQLQISNPARSLITLRPEVMVGQVNQAPVLAAITTQTVTPGGRVEIQLAATDPNNDRLTFALSGDTTLPAGSLQASTGQLEFTPAPEDLGTYQVEVSASDGVLSTTRTFTLNVIADPITTTRVSGRVLDVDLTPLVGIQVELGSAQGLTQSDGSFQLDLGSGPLASNTLKIRGETFVDPTKPDVVYPFIAEKLPFMLGHEPYVGFNNIIFRSIFLPKLDVANGKTINPTQNTMVTTDAIPGIALAVAAGSLMNQQGSAFTGVLSITEVAPELTPAVLPSNLFPDLVVTIQPGEMVFTTPAPLSFPNRSGWAPGTLMDLWSINPVTGEFDDVGDMQVSADGTTIDTITGGVRNSSWHFPAPPPPEPKPKPDNDRCDECERTEPANSDVNLNSGAITENHDLATYQSLGQPRGVSLTYDSVRADPRPIVRFTYEDVNPNIFSVPDALKIVARLSVNVNGVVTTVPGFSDAPDFGLRGGEHFFSIPAGGGPLDAALQVDLRDQPTGLYTYTLNTGLRGFTGTRFIGSDNVSRDQLVHVNTVNSSFGSGWGIDGLQQLVESSDGSLLLVDGDGSASVFARAADSRRDLVVIGQSNNILRYNEATGAFEETLADVGTGGLNDAKDALFGPDGNLYVANFGNRNVLRFNGQSGAFIDEFVAPNSGGLQFPTVLAFGPDGNLYVGQGGPGNTGGGGNVLRYNGTTGAFVDVFADAKASSGLDLINGIAFGPDGNLYVSSTDRSIFTNADRVLRYNGTTGAFIDTFVAPGELDDLGALTFGPDGDLYMIDARFSHVQRYSGVDGTFKGVFTSGGNLATAFDLQFGPNGNLFVASRGNDQVQEFNGTTGVFIDQFVSAGDGGLDAPQAIVFRPASSASTSEFVAPPGDFSSLMKLADGTFQRTLIDQTIYTFDVAGKLDGITDRNGNETRYEYDAAGLLFKITDPVGLVTTFTYSAGKVATITDPAGRVTEFDHDEFGNLIRITDPDGAQRNWEYDANHHMTAETNQRGDREQTFYDDFGRAFRSIRADGSIIEIAPAQVQGLYPTSQSIDPTNAPFAFRPAGGDARYIDGNGNVLRTLLDGAGQEIGSIDAIGPQGTIERNAANLITKLTDARGNIARFTYDNRGNLLTIEDSISGVNLAGRVAVDGRTNIFGAGHTTAPAPNGGGGGLLPIAIPLAVQSSPLVLTFGAITGQIIGNTSRCQFNGPDGGTVCRQSTNVSSFGGISGIRHDSRTVFLVGVFLDGSEPNDPAPPVLNVTSANEILDFTPVLRQVFYIGDGRTADGTIQQFRVPEGATRFYLGFVDNFDSTPTTPQSPGFFNDNGGFLTVPYEITSSEASPSRFTYDPTFSQITSQTDELGQPTLFDIDPANGNIRSITRVVGAVGGDDDLVTQFTYTTQGLTDTQTDPLGRSTDYDYDGLGRLVTLTMAKGTADEGVRRFEYDLAGNVTAAIDENGQRTDYVYDALNRVTRITEPDPDADGPLARPITTIVYDRAGNLTSTTDQRANTSRYEYDTLDRLTKAIDPNTSETLYGYDLAGNRTSVIDPLGHETRYRYDARNRLVETIDPDNGRTKFRYDADDNATAVTDPVGNVTQRSYDSRDRLVRETDPLGNQVGYAYDAADNLIGRTELEAATTTRNRQFDNFADLSGLTLNGAATAINATPVTVDGQVVLRMTTNRSQAATVFLTEPVVPSIADLTSFSTSFQFQITGAEGIISDEDGRGADGITFLLATSPSLLGRNGGDLGIGGVGPSVAVEFDTNNNGLPSDHSGNHVGIDLNGNLTSIVQANVTPRFNDGNVWFAWIDYNAASQQLEVRVAQTSQRPAEPLVASTVDLVAVLGQSTAFVGFSAGTGGGGSQRQDIRSWQFTAAYSSITVRREIEFAYDDLNRRLSETWVNGDNTIAYAYDKASNLLSATDSFSGLALTYDARDRLRTVDNAGTPGVPNVVLTYAYDPAGNLLSTTDTIAGAAGGLNSYTYDGLDRITRITQSGASVAAKRVDLAYDSLGQFSSLQRFSDVAGTQLVVGSNYVYDSLNRLTGLHHSNAANADVAFFDLVYDARNRITRITDIDGATAYTYDDRDELIAADHADANNPDETYTYDANGNRVTSSLHGNGYVTGPNNRLLSDGTYNYIYDPEGNLARRTEIASGNFREFIWDHRNRLVAVIDKDVLEAETQRVEFTYDAFDRRISKAVQAASLNTLTHFVYDRSDVLLDFEDTDGAASPITPVLAQRYLHGPAVDQVLAQDDGLGNVIWHLADHLGSVHDLVNSSGAVVNHLTYDSFGNFTAQSNSTIETRYRFTGREYDSETGLHFYRARYYDAAIGQFLTEDPLGLAGGDLNLRRYVLNNPLSATDPSGLTPCDNIKRGLEALDRAIRFLKDDVLRELNSAIRQPVEIQEETAGTGLNPSKGINAAERRPFSSMFDESKYFDPVDFYDRAANSPFGGDFARSFYDRKYLFDLRRQTLDDLKSIENERRRLQDRADKCGCE